VTDTVHVFLPVVQTGAEVKLLRFGVPDGGVVLEGDLLAELECRKAAYPFHAPAAGVVRWALPEGVTRAAGTKLCEIDPP
jgi:biotin carboxyl carrier protein